MGYAGHHGHVLRVIPRYVDVDDGRDDALIGSATSDAVRTNRDPVSYTHLRAHET